MPSGITVVDSMYSVRSTPWHGEGVVLDNYPKSIDEAITASGLDWTVEQYPVAAVLDETEDTIDVEPLIKTVYYENGDELATPMFWANVRSDTRQPLGIVTDRYVIVQNRSAFSFLSNLYGTDMFFETAGSLQAGRRVWVLMKLPSWVEVAGDAIAPFALIFNSHDGKSSICNVITPVRAVCQNTINLGIASAKQRYNIRHMGDINAKIAEARNVLGVTINYYEQFKQYGDKMGITKLSDKRAKTALENLFPITEADGNRAARNREEAREAVMQLFKHGVGPVEYNTTIDTVDTRPQNALGSVWAFYNACTEYLDWGRSVRKSRFQRVIDDPNGLKARAATISLELANLPA